MPSTAARRLTRHHNEAMRRGLQGGFVLVDTEGNGGAYYTQGSQPEGGIRCTVGHSPLTYQGAQLILDNAAGQRREHHLNKARRSGLSNLAALLR
jgi:homoserine acetyltransferase